MPRSASGRCRASRAAGIGCRAAGLRCQAFCTSLPAWWKTSATRPREGARCGRREQQDAARRLVARCDRCPARDPSATGGSGGQADSDIVLVHIRSEDAGVGSAGVAGVGADGVVGIGSGAGGRLSARIGTRVGLGAGDRLGQWRVLLGGNHPHSLWEGRVADCIVQPRPDHASQLPGMTEVHRMCRRVHERDRQVLRGEPGNFAYALG